MDPSSCADLLDVLVVVLAAPVGPKDRNGFARESFNTLDVRIKNLWLVGLVFERVDCEVTRVAVDVGVEV